MKCMNFPGVWGKYTDIHFAEEACLPDAKSCFYRFNALLPKAASAVLGMNGVAPSGREAMDWE